MATSEKKIKGYLCKYHMRSGGLFYKCKKCGRIVWFWQSKAAVTLTLKNGRKKKIRLCVGCAMRLAEKLLENTGEGEGD